MLHPANPPTAIPLPLLITGVAGMAGYNALHYFQEKYPGRVIGIRQVDNYRLTGPGLVACNVEDRDWHRRRPADEPRSPEYLHKVLCRNPGSRWRY